MGIRGQGRPLWAPWLPSPDPDIVKASLHPSGSSPSSPISLRRGCEAVGARLLLRKTEVGVWG